MSFHSVGDHGLPGDMRHLTTSPEVLEGALRWLKKRGFVSVTQQQLFGHLAHGKTISDPAVLLAFDDGYLDNWVWVKPLLEKYGMRGVIYVTSEFIESGKSVRLDAGHLWRGSVTRDALPGLGYCNSAELRAMAQSGVLELGSHLITHSWLPTSGKILDFHRPDATYPWACWNAASEEKPHWLHWSEADYGRVLPWGTPIYVNARSHAQPAATPDPEVAAALTSAASDPTFFARDNWREELRRVAVQAGCKEIDDALHAPLVAKETRDEFEARFESECRESRALLEQISGQPCPFMAWPGGIYDTRLQELALRHYDATFTTDFGVNRVGDDPRLIKRSFFAQRSSELMGKAWPSVLHFSGRVRRLRGQGWARLHTGIANCALKRAAVRRGDTGSQEGYS
ncbi:MAG: polysaccharide deacetylase family protein [Planctomycetes bacterium]|nr:polysaccharide deacetylase family protein [Planctomycetota bacterium]